MNLERMSGLISMQSVMVQLPEGIKLKMPEIHYIDNFYVMEDVNAEGVVK